MLSDDSLLLTQFLKLIRHRFSITASLECFHTPAGFVLHLCQAKLKASQYFRLVGDQINMIVSRIVPNNADICDSLN